MNEGYHAWMRIETILAIDPEGTLHCTLCNSTESQQQWLDAQDFKSPQFEQLLNTSALGLDTVSDAPAVGYDTWCPSVEQLIDLDALCHEVLIMLQAAQSHVRLHACWLALPGVSETIAAAYNNCIDCMVFGRWHQLEVLPDELKGRVKMHDLGESTYSLHEFSLVLDGDKPLTIDKVQLSTPQGRQIHAFIAARLKRSHVQTFDKMLLSRQGDKPSSNINLF